jgi:two-component system response regulator
MTNPQSEIHNPQSDETPQSAIRNPKLILVIDDSEDDILLTQMVLKKIRGDIEVEAALSGAAGLAFLRGGEALPALILLDLKIPGMDGLHILRAIRADERLCRISVVVLTHSDLESDKEASFTSGASGFLNKSVDLNQFAEEIRKELERWM